MLSLCTCVCMWHMHVCSYMDAHTPYINKHGIRTCLFQSINVLFMYVHIQYTNFLSSLQVCTLCPVYIYERVCQCRCTCKQKKDEDSCTMNNNKYVYTHVCACSILYSCICFYYSMCMFVLYCTYMYVHVSVYVIVHVRVCLCGGVYGCMRVMCVCMCTYINACTYVCMYTCAYNQSP